MLLDQTRQVNCELLDLEQLQNVPDTFTLIVRQNKKSNEIYFSYLKST